VTGFVGRSRVIWSNLFTALCLVSGGISDGTTQLLRIQLNQEFIDSLQAEYPTPAIAQVLADSSLPLEDREWLDLRLRSILSDILVDLVPSDRARELQKLMVPRELITLVGISADGDTAFIFQPDDWPNPIHSLDGSILAVRRNGWLGFFRSSGELIRCCNTHTDQEIVPHIALSISGEWYCITHAGRFRIENILDSTVIFRDDMECSLLSFAQADYPITFTADEANALYQDTDSTLAFVSLGSWETISIDLPSFVLEFIQSYQRPMPDGPFSLSCSNGASVIGEAFYTHHSDSQSVFIFDDSGRLLYNEDLSIRSVDISPAGSLAVLCYYEPPRPCVSVLRFR
jgi:hypothetical protein